MMKLSVLDPVTKGYLTLRPAAAARTLARLDSRDTRAVFEAMPQQLAVSVLQHMNPRAAASCLAELPVQTAAEILARAPVLTAVAVLRVLQRDQVKTLLAGMPRSAAARLLLRMRYQETLIGAYVDDDVITLRQDQRVGDALRLFRRTGQHTGHVIYVLDEHRHLAGVVDLGDLLGERDRGIIQRLMHPAPVVLNARAALQTVSDHPAWLTHDSLPVVNRDDVFQGVLRRSNVMLEEQQLLTEVADRNETATTRSALADIFWLGVGALFVRNTGQVEHSRSED
jgi:magnesium transporter